MRALVLHGPGDLRLENIADPVPGPGEVVIGVEAAATCATDAKILRSGRHPALPQLPTPFGHEAAGLVVAIGHGVTTVAVGDRVVPANSAPCDQCRFCESGATSLCDDLIYLWGAFAEKLRVPERIVQRNLVAVPDGVSLQLATLAEPLACAVRAVARLGPSPGSSVVVIGGGTQGAFLCGLLADRGCQVIVCDPHEERRERAIAFGATATHPALRVDDDVAELRRVTEGGADFVVEAVGAPSSWEAAMATARPGGTVLFYGGCPPDSMVRVPTATLHYEELTLTGSYHHDPVSFRAAVALLEQHSLPFECLFGDPIHLSEVPGALLRRGPKRPVVVGR